MGHLGPKIAHPHNSGLAHPDNSGSIGRIFFKFCTMKRANRSLRMIVIIFQQQQQQQKKKLGQMDRFGSKNSTL